METKSLFIGRFQPFHIGHLSSIKNIIQNGEHCIIVIAAANKFGTWLNPLTGDEREHILRETLKEEKDLNSTKYEILQLADIDDDSRWQKYVIDSVPHFDKVYSGSKFVRNFFENNKKFKTIEIKKILDKNKNTINATTVRSKILTSENYDKYLRPRTKEILDELAFKERLVKITMNTQKSKKHLMKDDIKSKKLKYKF